MRLLVCGGRDFNNRQAVFSVLYDFEETSEGVSCIIHGGAKGADAWAAEWAQTNGIDVQEFPADWEKYARSAGPTRNAVMLKEGQPDAVLAFPGGRGTADMIGQARAAGVDVYVVRVKTSLDLAPSDWVVET